MQTLHKNASEGEKDEFLQEALLMSNFKHEHIIQLLGVCLDNDPQFIILELMEGGDLLSYLRASRPSVVSAELKFYLMLMNLDTMCERNVTQTDQRTESQWHRVFCVALHGRL